FGVSAATELNEPFCGCVCGELLILRKSAIRHTQAIGGLRAEKAVSDFGCRDGGVMQSKQTNSSGEGMRPETRTLWARTTLRVAPEKYCLVSLPTRML